MSELDRTHPYSGRVERMPGIVVVFTRCCGARVFFPSDEAAPEVELSAVCPRDGVGWALEFVADEAVDGGLRPVWSVPHPSAGRAVSDDG